MAAEKKRGPGRPPSKPAAPAIERRGIVDSPDDPLNRLEFAFEDPMAFKLLFAYFKNLRAREIHLRCRPDGLTFFARDHTKTSRVVAHVAGRHVNWHYCEGEFWLGVNRDQFESMFAGIDKTLFKVSIRQTADDPHSLTFVFKDPELEKENYYKMTLSTYPRDEELYEAEAALTPAQLAAYPVEFTLGAKQFKKTVGDAAKYSDVITIEKLGDHPLQFTYSQANVVYHEVYRSAEKISLRSAVAPGAAFHTTVKIDNLKSLAAAMVADDLRILCREGGDMVFRSAFEGKALVVSTLTGTE